VRVGDEYDGLIDWNIDGFGGSRNNCRTLVGTGHQKKNGADQERSQFVHERCPQKGNFGLDGLLNYYYWKEKNTIKRGK
jgi:hypothetical protein